MIGSGFFKKYGSILESEEIYKRIFLNFLNKDDKSSKKLYFVYDNWIKERVLAKIGRSKKLQKNMDLADLKFIEIKISKLLSYVG